MGILLFGHHLSTYSLSLESYRDLCVLGLSISENDISESPHLCNFNLAVCCLSCTSSLSILCLEIYGQTCGRWKYTISMIEIYISVLVIILWAMSLVFTLWAWLVTVKESPGRMTSGVKPSVGSYFACNAASIVSWVRSCLTEFIFLPVHVTVFAGICVGLHCSVDTQTDDEWYDVIAVKESGEGYCVNCCCVMYIYISVYVIN